MKNPLENWGKNSKGIIMGTAMLGSVNAKANINTELPKMPEGKKIEIKSETKNVHDEKTFNINKLENLNRNTNEKINREGLIEDSLNLEQFCKTGSIEFVSHEARENAMNAIAEFLKNADLENNSINIIGLCSHERPTSNNDELRENRRKLGVEMVNEALSKIFTKDQVDKILMNLESSSKEMSVFDLGITEEEFNNMDKGMLENLIDQTQGIKISLKKIVKIEYLGIEQKIPEPYGNVISVILDNSKSMAGEASEALKIIKKINEKYEKDIKVVSLEGGNKEAHLNTLIDVLLKEEVQEKDNNEILVLTDEPDNNVTSFEEYNILVQKVLELAKEKNINIKIKVFHPDNTIGGSKIIDLKIFPQALFIDQSARKNGSSISFSESKLKKWYEGLDEGKNLEIYSNK